MNKKTELHHRTSEIHHHYNNLHTNVLPNIVIVGKHRQGIKNVTYITLVNVYVDLLVFTHIAGTTISFLSIQYVHGDLCKHLGIDSSHTEYWLKSIVLVAYGIFFYIVFTPISITSGL